MAKRLDACRSGKDFINYGTTHGAKVVRQNGSHVILATDRGKVPVPYHGAHDLGTGLRAKIVKAFVAIGVAVALLGIVVWGASAGGPAPTQRPSAPASGANGCLMWQFSPGGSPAFIEHRKETKMFGDLLAELALKAGLDRADAEDLRLKGNNYELVNAQLSALFSQRNVFTGDQDFMGVVRFTQGGVTVDETGINAGNAVTIDQQGVFVKNDQSSALSFGDSANNRQYIDIKSGLNDELRIRNLVPGGNGGINVYDTMASGSVIVLQVLEDPNVADRALIKLWAAPAGSKLLIGDQLSFTAAAPDTTGGTFMTLRGGIIAAVNPTPPDPATSTNVSETHVYVRNEKLIFQYNDNGTVRYKYLPLNGTSVTWVHTTTAP